VYLLWVFRHFHSLPHKVLSRRQQRLVDRLCADHRFVSWAADNRFGDVPLIGTIERRPPVEVESFGGAYAVSHSDVTPLAARQRS
jgi:hypothetical protein